MYKFVVLLAGLAAVSADVSHLFNKPNRYQATPYQQPQYASSHGQVGILRQHSDISADGSYDFGYETENGIQHQEGATIKHTGPENAAKSAQGSYSFTSPEGEVVQVSYVADENGFQPQGSHIPTPPPIPDAIQRAIDYILAHPPQNLKHDHQQYNQQQSQYGRQSGGKQKHYF